jgi:hypothetical protein
MSVYAPALGYIWKNAKEFGLDPEELFKEAGIDPGLRLSTSLRKQGLHGRHEVSEKHGDVAVCRVE